MNFEESLQYLLDLGNEVSAMKLGLENISKLVNALGNPEKNYLKVQIAGTNGKGSTCAFLEAICVDAKIKTGLTTSPHLVSITERVRINGREIGEDDFARHATKIRNTSEKLVFKKTLKTVPTFFEQVTAIALSAFAEAGIELAILETGLGGRFDATTAARAEIAAITPVDYDHQQILGNTLEEIAAEKAAIIREDTKVVVSPQIEKAKKVILDRCADLGVTPKWADFADEIVEAKNGKFTVDFQTADTKYENVKVNLRGRHQIDNAKIAVLLAETLQESFNITTENIVEGLQTAIHQGRLEIFDGILLDGAHNISGAKALRNFLDEFTIKPITLIFGAMKDKDLKEIAAILFPKADILILTVPDNSRSMNSSEIMKFLPQEYAGKKVYQSETVAEALEMARKMSPAENLICIAGSLYLVGEARKNLAQSNN